MTETRTDLEASVARGGDEYASLRCCVVLPAYNEARALPVVVARIPARVTGIFVVDDASSDATLSVAQSLTDPRVTVLHHDDNGGVGGAMVSGYRAALEAGYDVAIKMEADAQMDADELPALVRCSVWGWRGSAGLAE
jgi:dolichol-phosphate mannosyltransferase